MVTMTRAQPVATPVGAGSCRKKCPGGYKCNCDGEIEHALHICKESTCWCHSQDRYEGKPYKGKEN